MIDTYEETIEIDTLKIENSDYYACDLEVDAHININVGIMRDSDDYEDTTYTCELEDDMILKLYDKIGDLKKTTLVSKKDAFFIIYKEQIMSFIDDYIATNFNITS